MRNTLLLTFYNINKALNYINKRFNKRLYLAFVKKSYLLDILI